MIDTVLELISDNWFWIFIFGGTITSIVGSVFKKLDRTWGHLTERIKQLNDGHRQAKEALKRKESLLDKMIYDQNPNSFQTSHNYFLAQDSAHETMSSGIVANFDWQFKSCEDYEEGHIFTEEWYDGRNGVEEKLVIKTNQLKEGSVGSKVLRKW